MKLKEQTVNAIFQYLVTKPYQEVVVLIQSIQEDIKQEQIKDEVKD